MRKLVTIVLILFVIVMTGVTFYTCSTLFETQYDIKKGSLSYYIYIPKTIRDFPIIDSVSDPKYYSIPIDVHPGYNGVTYETRLDYDAVHTTLSNELNKQGFVIQEKQIVEGEYSALNSDESEVINIVISDNEKTVKIRAYEVYW